ncbi:MAG: hypothetical protein Ct9H90mP6_08190 [Gammaproteobacteria bacterium]|nr:MAG: hypothetical protein Ct9H90mP6_08190 [Gammaproteobacteria bacterium]
MKLLDMAQKRTIEKKFGLCPCEIEAIKMASKKKTEL